MSLLICSINVREGLTTIKQQRMFSTAVVGTLTEGRYTHRGEVHSQRVVNTLTEGGRYTHRGLNGRRSKWAGTQ